MKFYLFNPEHDMALASFSPYYMVPAEISRMRNDLSALPAWFADKDGVVGVISDDYIKDFSEQCIPKGVKPYGQLLDVEACSQWSQGSGMEQIVPWGWDPALVQRLKLLGVDSCLLPNEETLQSIKVLSGRQQCVRVLSDFNEIRDVCGEAKVCASLDEVHNFLVSHRDVILKAPWSGSGRGLTRTSLSTWTPNLEGWVARILRTQGNIMAEPIYNKVLDFAMEFHLSSENCLTFAGYSLFETDTHGNYKENVLASNENIIARLSRYVAVERLEEVKQHLLDSLRKMFVADSHQLEVANYIGYFGVDMMICEETTASAETAFFIHPCVEINLRMNMGVVARLLFDRYMDLHSEGSYVVEHYNKDGEALEHDSKLRTMHPSCIKEGKMVEGYFPLTPVTTSTRYQCYIICHSLA